MNSRDKKDLQEAGDTLCKWWQENHSETDCWHRREYKQGLHDALEALKQCRLIKDYDLRYGVTLYEGQRPYPRRFVPTGKAVKI